MKNVAFTSDTVVVEVLKDTNKYRGSALDRQHVEYLVIDRTDLVAEMRGGRLCTWYHYKLSRNLLDLLHQIGMDGWDPWSWEEEGVEFKQVEDPVIIKTVMDEAQPVQMHWYVLDYSTGRALHFVEDARQICADSEVLRRHGLKDTQCSWMKLYNEIDLEDID